ncbi:disulfide bond formation protein B [Candidatus Pacearchaeota archaeon]|nr:disulfide bond formation protein B [Candidatus Pacearchaeota archaeon]|tara:strand:- start:4585 stop:5151 length:567 start_codon:yes stop_codon:yes gene_type:complete
MAEIILFNKILALGTLVLQIAIVTFFLAIIWAKNRNKKLPSFCQSCWNFLKQNSLLLAFLTVLGGTLASLFYSEIIDYAACELCWFQRALIYPQVIILGIALWKKQKDIFDYVIALNIIGSLIALYQYYLQRFNVSTNCGSGDISCSSVYILEFGYITIPMMALTLFVAVSILTYIYKHPHFKKSEAL